MTNNTNGISIERGSFNMKQIDDNTFTVYWDCIIGVNQDHCEIYVFNYKNE